MLQSDVALQTEKKTLRDVFDYRYEFIEMM